MKILKAELNNCGVILASVPVRVIHSIFEENLRETMSGTDMEQIPIAFYILSFLLRVDQSISSAKPHCQNRVPAMSDNPSVLTLVRVFIIRQLPTSGSVFILQDKVALICWMQCDDYAIIRLLSQLMQAPDNWQIVVDNRDEVLSTYRRFFDRAFPSNMRLSCICFSIRNIPSRSFHCEEQVLENIGRHLPENLQ